MQPDMTDRCSIFAKCLRLACLALPIVLAPARPAEAQRRAGSRAGEALFLDTDAAAAKKLAAARDLLSARQWSDGIDLVRQIAEQHGDKMVAASDGRYVSVQQYCNLLLSDLPAEGLLLYRKRTDPQARRWFESATGMHDEAGLRKIIRHAFLSSYGDEALWLLGELAWERGEVARARAYWEQLLPLDPRSAAGELAAVLRYPDASTDAALVRARLVLCSLMLGDVPRGERELAAFEKLHAQASGYLAGREGNLAATLAGQAELARQSMAAARSPETATFAGNACRNLVYSSGVDAGAVVWSEKLEPVRFDRAIRRFDDALDLPFLERGMNFRFERLGGAGPVEALSCFPVVRGNLLFYCDDNTVYARELLSETPGRGAWNSDAAIFRLPRDPSPPGAGRRRAGAPQYTLSLAEDRLFARLGDASIRGAQAALPAETSALVCLDLARQGDLAWLVKADELGLDGAGWIFDGAPVPDGDRLYVAMRRHTPQLQLNIGCFSAATGRMLWNRKVGLGLENFGGEIEEIQYQLLTVADDQVFCCTNLGGIAALDAREGALRWVTSYPRAEIETIVEFNRRQRYGPNPCLYDGGVLFAVPTDSDRVLALDAESGQLIWDAELPEHARQLLGVSDGKLIVAGDLLWALNADTGRVDWKIGSSAPEAGTLGRGVLANGLVYWPKRDEISLCEIATGREQRKIALAQSLGLPGGGNIVLADGLLVLAQAGRLSVIGEYGGLKKRHDDEVARAADDSQAWFRLGLIESAWQHPDKALIAWRQARTSACAHDEPAPLRNEIDRHLSRLLFAQAERALASGQSEPARATFEGALNVALPEERFGMRRRLAEMLEESGDLAQAARVWQGALDELSAQGFEAGSDRSRSAARQAAAEIDRLISVAGRDVYRQIEDAAQAEFARALDEDRLADVWPLLERYPHADSARKAGVRLAELLGREGDSYGSDRAWRRILDLAGGDRRTAARAYAGLAANAMTREHWRTAANCFQKLYDEFPDAIVSVAGQSASARELAPRFLTRIRENSLDAPRHASGESAWVRRWERTLSAGGVCVAPVGVPPAAGLGCICVCGAWIECLDLHDGHARWQLGLPDPPHWSGFIAGLLVLGGDSFVMGVAPEDGAIAWRRELSRSSADAPTRFAAGDDALYVLVAGSGLQCLRGEDGTTVWKFAPRQGRLQSCWKVDRDRIAVQTLRPDCWQLLNAADGALVADGPGPSVAWRNDPRSFPQQKLLGLSTDRHDLALVSSVDGRLQATYQGPISRVFSQPEMVQAGPAALAVIDATTLSRFDFSTGKPQWTRRLGPVVTRDAGEHLCADAERLYVASGGILRSISLADGRLQWEQYLGPVASSWCVLRTPEAVAAYPRGTSLSASIVFCDPATGALVERLNFRDAMRDVQLYSVNDRAVVTTDSRVYGLARREQ